MPDHWLTEEEVAFRLLDAARAKHKQRRLDFDLKYNDVLREVRKGVCAKTGLPFDHRERLPGEGPRPWQCSLDRIDNDRGYTPDNIRCVSKMYNTAKNIWYDVDVLRMAEALVRLTDRKQEEIVRKYLGHRQGNLL